MNRASERGQTASTRVRRHFRRHASGFDRLYDDDGLLQRRLRPGLIRRRDIALSTIDSYPSPSVLDVGCGSGRVAELVLEHGASRYVGVDFSDTMLELAAARLRRFGDRATLVQGDFLTASLEGPFDVVLALGLFDYLPDAASFTTRMGELCAGSLVASFPGWNWFKGPIRKVRYELLRGVPIFTYTRSEIQRLLGDGGFSAIEFEQPGHSGFVVRADVKARSASGDITRPPAPSGRP